MDGRRTCTACRSAKVKCDRQSPVCGRCARLQLSCVEQVRKQGRPSGTAGGGASFGGGGGGLYSQSGGAAEGDTQLINEFILQTFQKLHQSQKVDMQTTLTLLQVSSLMSTVFKADFQGGLSPRVQFFTRTSLSTLRDTDEVHEEMDHLEKSLHVRWKDGTAGFGKIHPALRSFDDRVSMVACVTSICGAACKVMCNHHFSELLWSAKELYRRIEDDAMTPFFVWSKLVAPEDRLDFLEALTKYCFCPPDKTTSELSQIVKMKGRSEAIFLAIVRLRMVVFGNGRYLSVIFSASPAPSSKYLRGGNRDVELPPSSSGPPPNLGGFSGLNMMDQRFRYREPSPSLEELKPDFVHSNVEDERVKAFLQTVRSTVISTSTTTTPQETEGGEAADLSSTTSMTAGGAADGSSVSTEGQTGRPQEEEDDGGEMDAVVDGGVGADDGSQEQEQQQERQQRQQQPQPPHLMEEIGDEDGIHPSQRSE